MHERTKGLIVLGASAVAAAVFLQSRKQDEPARAPTPSASAPAASPAPAPTARKDLERAIAELEKLSKPGASDPASPWALAHGLLAFGPEHTASDGRLAIDVIGTFAEKEDGRWGFPEAVEPHRHILVKTLLEVGVPLEREIAKGVTLKTLVVDMQKGAELPKNDRDWHHAAWLLMALQHGEKNKIQFRDGLSTEALGKAALERLEADHRVVSQVSLREAKEKKLGIYAHSCGGMHLVQAVVAAQTEPEPARVARQLGVIAYRYETEREAADKLLAEHPEHGLSVRVQKLKLGGHVIETLMLARRVGAYRPGTEGGDKLDSILRLAVSDVVEVAGELDHGGVPARLAQIRKDREQTYLDLVGDGCHAIHGLREALALYPK